MAKKKSKKSGMSVQDLVVKIVIIALAVLTVCTLFMPVISKMTSVLGGDLEASYHIYGKDVFAGLFGGEVSLENTEGANALITLKEVEGNGFVLNLFMILYVLTVVVATAVIVFNVLSLLKIRIKLIDMIVSVAMVVLAVATFIFAILTASKLGKLDLGVLAETKGVIAIGTYMLIGTLISGGAYAYTLKK